jgi:hypothetical protein
MECSSLLSIGCQWISKKLEDICLLTALSTVAFFLAEGLISFYGQKDKSFVNGLRAGTILSEGG